MSAYRTIPRRIALIRNMYDYAVEQRGDAHGKSNVGSVWADSGMNHTYRRGFFERCGRRSRNRKKEEREEDDDEEDEQKKRRVLDALRNPISPSRNDAQT
eukprot:442615-Pyramimonas_sp.AAC.1